MENVSKHYTEQERKSYRCINCWIDLLIKWNTIGINDLLERPHKIIRLNVRRSLVFLFIKLLYFNYLRAAIAGLS
jgi:hypothetical protein